MAVSLKIKMTKGKETPGTQVYVAPKVDADGNQNAVTSVYVIKDAFGGKPAPDSVTVTVEM